LGHISPFGEEIPNLGANLEYFWYLFNMYVMLKKFVHCSKHLDSVFLIVGPFCLFLQIFLVTLTLSGWRKAEVILNRLAIFSSKLANLMSTWWLTCFCPYRGSAVSCWFHWLVENVVEVAS
jgi:hypothetical protein